MRLTPSQLPFHLTSSLARCYVLYGSEDFLITDSAKRIRQQFLSAGDAEKLSFQCDGQKSPWEHLTEQLQSPSLFSPRQYIHLNIIKLLPSDPPKLLACLDRLSENQLCVIQCSGQLKSVHRAKWLQTLEKKHAACIAHYALSESQFTQWVMARAKAANLVLSAEQIKELTHYTQGNCLAAAQEIDVLALSRTSTLTEMPYQHQYDAFALCEAILKKQPHSIIDILSSLKVTQGVALSLILWILAQMCRVFIQAQSLSTPEQKQHLLQKMGIRKSSQPLMQKHLHQCNITACQRYFSQLSEIDCQLKSGELSPAWERTLTVCLDMSKQLLR